jgi:hypothetical protein
MANPINQPPYWLLGRSTDISSQYVDFARYFMAWWKLVLHKKRTQWPHTAVILAYASCTGNLQAKFWVDKTPTNERYLNRIWREMPGAKIIHVIRNPVATLVSHKRMQSSLKICNALRDLKISFGIALEHSVLKDPRFFLLRYEELCETPDRVIEELALFLTIRMSVEFSQPTVAGIPSQANSSFNKDAIPGNILKFDQHPPDEVLKPSETQLLNAYMGDLIGKLSYPVVQVGFFRRFYLKLRHRLL